MLSNQRLARKTKPKPNYQDSGLTKHVSNKSSSKFFTSARRKYERKTFYVSVAKVSESAGARPSSWDQLPEPEMRSEGL